MFCFLPYPLFLFLRLYALFRSGLLVSPPFFTLLVPSFPSTSLRLFSYPAGFPPLRLPSLPAVSTRSSLLPSVSFSVSYVAAFFFFYLLDSVPPVSSPVPLVLLLPSLPRVPPSSPVYLLYYVLSSRLPFEHLGLSGPVWTNLIIDHFYAF